MSGAANGGAGSAPARPSGAKGGEAVIDAVLIGFGYWGPNIARNLDRSPEFRLAAICDRDEGMLAKARGLYGDRVAYLRDWQEALALPGLGMAAVALRDRAAQEVSREVLKSGLHLFIEKPFATAMADALLLQSLANEHGRLIHVDHQLMYNPFIRRIKRLLESGELGDIIYFESNRANLGPHIKKDMNAMWDLAVHDVAVLDYLCGGLLPRKVKCIGQKKYGSQEIVTYMSLQYERFAAMIKSNWYSPLKERSMVVSGTRKMVVFDDLKESEKLMIYDKGVELTDEAYREYGALEAKIRMGDVYIPNIDFEDSLLNGLNQFGACIREGRPSLSDASQAIRVLTVLAMADQDLNEGARI